MPLSVSSWVLVSVPLPLILPPFQLKPFPVKANVAPPDAASSIPPLSCRLPVPEIAPEKLPENECVPPEKSSTPPDATVNVPSAYVLFAVNCSVPVSTWMVPLVLVNGTATVDVPVPLDFLNVPVLTTEFVPEKSMSPLSTWRSNVPLLLNVPLLNRKRDPVCVIVPWFDSVLDRYLYPSLPLSVSVLPVAMIVCPEPPIDPSVHVIDPYTVRSPAPVSVPPLRLNIPLAWIWEVTARVNVPPERLKVPGQSRLFTEVVLDRLTVFPLGMTTSSPAPGTVSPSQFVPVVQALSPPPLSQVTVAAWLVPAHNPENSRQSIARLTVVRMATS